METNFSENQLKDQNNKSSEKIIRKCDDKQFSNGMIRIKLLQTNDLESMIQVNNRNNKFEHFL